MEAQEILIYVLAAIAYFVPFYIAAYRHVNGLQLIFWFNLLLGWTFFAWILLVIVAFSLRTGTDHHHNPTISA